MNTSIIKRERRDHAVAVKPMSVSGLADTLPTRSVAKKSPLQVARHCTFYFCDFVIKLLIEVFQATMARRVLIGAGYRVHIVSLFVT